MTVIDLHTHSDYSDGTVSPARLVEMAAEAGLSAVALCDHNTVGGLPEFLAAAREKGLEGIPGVEVSTDYGETELHIVGLYLRPERCAPLTEAMDGMLIRKERSNRELVDALNRSGLSLDYEAIKAGTADGFVNRAVIAAEMVRRGYASTVHEAFSRWLVPQLGYFRPPKRLEVFETIRLLRSVGAVTVLAHPLLNLSEGELREFLPRAKGAGLDAMETLYSTYDRSARSLSRQIAEEFSLLESGGSDFHGANKPDIGIGVGRGDLRVPDRFLEKIRERSLSGSGEP